MVRLNLKVQSFTDVITNSSSELFCIITSSNFLQPIHDYLKELFPGNYSDEDMKVSIVELENDEGDPKGEFQIHIDCPYDSMKGAIPDLVIEALINRLNVTFGSENYEINWKDLCY